MIYVGIDVAKDKHDCFAMNSDGEILIEKMTIQNNFDGFSSLFNSISQFNESFENIKVGLEAIFSFKLFYSYSLKLMILIILIHQLNYKLLQNLNLLNATRLVCMCDKTFSVSYLFKSIFQNAYLSCDFQCTNLYKIFFNFFSFFY